MAEQKTNVMRVLEQKKIPYSAHAYPHGDEAVDGVQVAELIGRPVEQVFKTLVAKGDKTGPVVFCMPVDLEIDLKKAARVTGNKRIEMVHVKDLPGLTGYIRGGCSPIGMKKQFPTYLHASATSFERITVSAGVRGAQLLLKVDDLLRFVGAKTADLAE